MDETLVRLAIDDYDAIYDAAKDAASKALKLQLLVAKLPGTVAELQITMDELNQVQEQFKLKFQTASNNVDELLTKLERPLDAIDTESKLVGLDDADKKLNMDCTGAELEARVDLDPTGTHPDPTQTEMEASVVALDPTGTEPEKAAAPNGSSTGETEKHDIVALEETVEHDKAAMEEMAENNGHLPDLDARKRMKI